MDKLMDQTVLFVFILALSLLIERLLEVLKSIYDFVDYRLGWDSFWSGRAARLTKKIDENISALEQAHHEQIGSVIRQYAGKLLGSGDNGVITVSGDLFRATTVRFVAKLIAMAIGIALACSFQLDIISIWQTAWHDAVKESAQVNSGVVAHLKSLIAEPLKPWIAQTITGVVIGLGSAPLHKVITSIERQQKKSAAKKQGGKHV
jgi:hypothetical protein